MGISAEAHHASQIVLLAAAARSARLLEDDSMESHRRIVVVKEEEGSVLALLAACVSPSPLCFLCGDALHDFVLLLLPPARMILIHNMILSFLATT